MTNNVRLKGNLTGLSGPLFLLVIRSAAGMEFPTKTTVVKPIKKSTVCPLSQALSVSGRLLSRRETSYLEH